MNPSRKLILVAAIVVFVVGVVALFPARVAYKWFVPDVVQMSGIEGTAWSGRAAEISAGGVYLRDLDWQVSPVRLLTGALAIRVEATPPTGFIEAHVAFGFGGTVRISDLNGSIPLQLFANPLQQLGLAGLSGSSSAQFELIVIRDGLPTEAEGTFAVASLVAPTIDRDLTVLGSYRAEFMTTDSGIVASVEDAGAVFDLAGSLTISADRTFLFLGQIAATSQTPEKLRQRLRFLGSANDRGQHEIRFEGSI